MFMSRDGVVVTDREVLNFACGPERGTRAPKEENSGLTWYRGIYTDGEAFWERSDRRNARPALQRSRPVRRKAAGVWPHYAMADGLLPHPLRGAWVHHASSAPPAVQAAGGAIEATRGGHGEAAAPRASSR
ncbi:hypothetical protein NDU88_000279 [Pleurodeles waltl]|uniref:Uncharacterized protein n=1 Tax=Pleurodeles waltl TaxID=8319 RepID=A0AAV7U5T6_PLEWA|nr:hypothetical protein NDU88_000279 [Pleurodeles waltl]